MERIGLVLRKTALVLKELAEAFEEFEDDHIIDRIPRRILDAPEHKTTAIEPSGKKRHSKRDPDAPKRPLTSVR